MPLTGKQKRALRALAQDDDDDAADEPVGPGWFESSQDLVSGLEVQESLPSDAWLNDWQTGQGMKKRDVKP